MDKKDAKQIIDQTIADYNLIAEKFSSTRRTIPDDLRILAKEAGEKDKVLDYGCGNGRLCELFSCQNYLGADASTELIKIAKFLHPGYHFEQIKPGGLPSKQDFDAIFCLSVIHHFPDRSNQLKLLNNLHQLLNNAGKLIITSWLIDQSDQINIVPFSDGKTIINRQIFSFSQNNLEELLSEAGFSIYSSKITPRNRGRYSNIEIIAKKII